MNILDVVISLGLNPKKVTAGEYASPCPFCGGEDRFHIWPDKKEHGAYWCRQCQKKGDAISLVMEAMGKTFREACAYLGKELPARRRTRTPTAPRKAPDEFTPRQILSPAEKWQREASGFAEASHATLLKTPDQIAWLAARGITEETARRFNLGWNARKIYYKRSGWGVENETVIEDGKEKVLDLLVLHRGLVIPYLADGRIESLRIRRPEEGIDDRYRVVKGSASKPMMIYCSDKTKKGSGAWVIVESRLDAILIAQDAGDLVGVAALDSVATKPDGALYEELKRAAHIINALDFDAAGAKAWPWWEEHFPQADRWPVPSGKDPGDYRKEGGDIRAWIIAGLPYGLRPVSPIAPPDKQPEEPTGTTAAGQKPSNPSPYFDPEGVLAAAFKEAKADGWDDERLLDYIEALIGSGALKAPWGFLAKGSRAVETFGGEFWMVSDEAARKELSAGARSFTVEEMRPVIEAKRVFPKAKIVRA